MTTRTIWRKIYIALSIAAILVVGPYFEEGLTPVVE